MSDRFWEMADNFVQVVYKESNCPVIVCNDAGQITCSTDPGRIGDTHSGALKILAGEVDEAFVTAEDAAENPKIKEGYNCVILHAGKRIGTFGIAGTLEKVKPLARIASIMMAAQLHELEQKELIDDLSQKIFAKVDHLTRENTRIKTESKRVFGEIQAASETAIQNVAVTDDILKTIQDIASRSNILSLNGTIEASRAGDHGRAFSIVAGEMREMSKHTKDAATDVENNIQKITDSINALNHTLTSFSRISDEQYRMIDETTELIGQFKTAMSDLRNT